MSQLCSIKTCHNVLLTLQKKMDSKLEEFKQRLAGRVPSKSQVQFTPAPISEKVGDI